MIAALFILANAKPLPPPALTPVEDWALRIGVLFAVLALSHAFRRLMGRPCSD